MREQPLPTKPISVVAGRFLVVGLGTLASFLQVVLQPPPFAIGAGWFWLCRWDLQDDGSSSHGQLFLGIRGPGGS